MPASQRPDAIAMLKADHRKVEDLFAHYQKARKNERKKALADQICLELTIHTKIEEDIFYPACRGKIGDDLWHEAIVEHDGAKVLVAEIEAGNPGDEFFDAKIKVLSEMIRHHVKEEEKRAEGMFAQAREAGLDVEELGARLKAEKEALMAAYKNDGLPVPPTPSLPDTQLAHHGNGAVPAGQSIFSLFSKGAIPPGPTL